MLNVLFIAVAYVAAMAVACVTVFYLAKFAGAGFARGRRHRKEAGQQRPVE